MSRQVVQAGEGVVRRRAGAGAPAGPCRSQARELWAGTLQSKAHMHAVARSQLLVARPRTVCARSLQRCGGRVRSPRAAVQPDEGSLGSSAAGAARKGGTDEATTSFSPAPRCTCKTALPPGSPRRPRPRPKRAGSTAWKPQPSGCVVARCRRSTRGMSRDGVSRRLTATRKRSVCELDLTSRIGMRQPAPLWTRAVGFRVAPRRRHCCALAVGAVFCPADGAAHASPWRSPRRRWSSCGESCSSFKRSWPPRRLGCRDEGNDHLPHSDSLSALPISHRLIGSSARLPTTLRRQAAVEQLRAERDALHKGSSMRRLSTRHGNVVP